MERTPRDQVATVLALVIGAFVIISLVLLFVLALEGVETGEFWGALFALVASTMSALGGWLAGSSRRNGHDGSS